ncbi:MAG: hypothetical protein WBP29_02415 [Candidatus Zixiibacteriota bacterium]
MKLFAITILAASLVAVCAQAETGNAPNSCPNTTAYMTGAIFEVVGTADGSSWSWCLNGDDFVLCDLNVQGPASGASAAEIADSIVQSIIDAGCAGVIANRIENRFYVAVGGVHMAVFCIGAAGSAPQSCFDYEMPDSCQQSVLFVQPNNYECFACGDVDGNAIITISDAVYLINFIFAGGPRPFNVCSADADGSNFLTISDCVFLLNWMFAGGPAPIPCHF